MYGSFNWEKGMGIGFWFFAGLLMTLLAIEHWLESGYLNGVLC